VAALRLWDYLDWALYFFNFVLTPSMRAWSRRACEGVSGADVTGDGVVRWSAVVTVLMGMRYFFSMLITDARNSGIPDWRCAGLAGGCWFGWWLTREFISFSFRQGNSRFGWSRSWDRRAGDRCFLDSHGSWCERIERASGHQRGWRTGVDDAAEYVGVVWRAQKRLIVWMRAATEQGTPSVKLRVDALDPYRELRCGCLFLCCFLWVRAAITVLE